MVIKIELKNLEIDQILFLIRDETGCSGKSDKNIKGKSIVHSLSSVIPHMAEIDDNKSVRISATITLQGTMLKPLLIFTFSTKTRNIINELSFFRILIFKILF